MKELLTLVVPLLDRHELTNRVLENLNEQNCEFKIIIADGSVEEFDKLRVRYGVFYENLDTEYFYNGHDFDIHRYMNKMHNAFQKIETPFCMIFDNDDLIDLNGIRRGLYFLSKNLDYSTYRNDVRTINWGKNIEIKDSLYQEPSITQSSPSDRIVNSVQAFNSFNYAIFRTEQIKPFFEIMNFFKNNDFQLFSKCLAYFSACMGKCERIFDESYYYFIPGSSILQTGGKIHKFSQWMGTPFWEKSACLMISIVSKTCLKLHGEDVREDFAKAFVEEACKKAGRDFSDYKNLNRHIESSFAYDNSVELCLEKYNFDTKEYDCEKTEPRSNEEFVKFLAT